MPVGVGDVVCDRQQEGRIAPLQPTADRLAVGQIGNDEIPAALPKGLIELLGASDGRWLVAHLAERGIDGILPSAFGRPDAGFE